ncbi:uncharacterized protein B0I36DRAFT_24590 [Microdochium trichocladiopsis]|uniref:Uncharacterized protein n=1 Tax=Microdochium trichocladiopsis TaxID=1682393 RepID=A0A9P8YL75_9PEZI|nr:uncharacterized protein B0I36DRAFT_24590 [Microdochium trichocladiopsis]KAH7041581.1 hypothetical protein B0I36DRAFT_24590 [Microdochium trichocladiopsis]
MASADALAFTCSPHDLDLSQRHESGRLPSNLRRSPRRLAISTQALARAIKSCPTSPTGPDGQERPDVTVDKDATRAEGFRVLSKQDGLVKGHVDSAQSNLPVESTYVFSVLPDQEPFQSIVVKGRRHVPSSIPTKRARALHDVDGPGTSEFSCKKRRLRLQLITSRLSQPFSLPATHILNRESDDDDSPCISRFLKAAAIGAKRAGHESSMVRKAAILNSVRLRARQAAIARGHAEMAGLAARNTFLNHGHQVVTAPTVVTIGTRYPVSEGMPGHLRLPVGWRPHTTIGPGHATITAMAPVPAGPAPSHPSQVCPRTSESCGSQPTTSSSPAMPSLSTTSSAHSSPRSSQPLSQDDGDDEYGMAFPASDVDPRYADLSDDDMDDVYADFSAIFGSRSSQDQEDGVSDGTRSPDGSEHFYEEYLDELDGIPWMS